MANIIHTGMMTAVGVGAVQTASSVRARIARYGESTMLNKDYDPFVMALLSEECLPKPQPDDAVLAAISDRELRMLRLAVPALHEVLNHTEPSSGLPLFLGMPELTEKSSLISSVQFIEILSEQSGVQLKLEASKVFAHGRAAGMLALQEALKYLADGVGEYVLLGGVDSYAEPSVLESLDLDGRILHKGVMDGFVPGEGAGFLLLAADGIETGQAGLAQVVGPGLGQEQGHYYSDEPYRGDGLAQAFEQLFASTDCSNRQIKSVFASLNGENFWTKEWGVAYLRNHDKFSDPLQLEHPIDCFGDPGAALAPILIGLAAVGIEKGYIDSPSLIWCSSDREERGATLVSAI